MIKKDGGKMQEAGAGTEGTKQVVPFKSAGRKASFPMSFYGETKKHRP